MSQNEIEGGGEIRTLFRVAAELSQKAQSLMMENESEKGIERQRPNDVVR